MKKLNNDYFNSKGNIENLHFVLAISRKLKLKTHNIIKTLNRFKGLKYRQQTIYNDNKLEIINDSKSTSFASSESLLRNLKNVYWIIGGIPKKGDRFNLDKKFYKNV